MNAEVLIKARKVFLKNKIIEHSETCPHCASKGRDYKLRYYYISLEEAIYKCANPHCLYPFKQFIFKSLIDSSVYYYEEVIDGGREAYLRVPLDGQKVYQSQTPLSTKEFCDSQRNPDIESYDCDFSDFFNDFEPEPQTKLKFESISKPSSNVNPDVLEFLEDCNETTPKANDQIMDKLFAENGIENLISNHLNESPVKTETNLKCEAKLSKCIQVIESAKTAKSRKQRNKKAETFTMAIEKMRKTQTKGNAVQSSVKQDPEMSNNSKAQSFERAPLKSVLKTTKNLRPTELAKELNSLKLAKFNIQSNFLREYMKAKEDKMFDDEPGSSTSDAVANEINNDVKKALMQLQPNVIQSSESVPDAIKATKIKSKLAAKVVRKERLDGELNQKDGAKKTRKPVVRKPKVIDKDATTIKKERDQNSLILDDALTQLPSTNNSEVIIKDEKPTIKRKTVSKKKTTDSKQTDDQNYNENEPKPKPKPKPKMKRNQKISLKTNDELVSTEAAKTENIKVKRPRKRKVDTENSNEEPANPKPKRVRSTKSLANSSKAELTSLPNAETEKIIELRSTSPFVGDIKSHESGSSNERIITTIPLEVAEISTSVSELDSEGSSEPLYGFTPPTETNIQVTDILSGINLSEIVAMNKQDDHSAGKTKLEAFIEHKPSSVPLNSGNIPRDSSKRTKKSKQEVSSEVKPKIVTKPRKNSTTTKHKIDMALKQDDELRKAVPFNPVCSGVNVQVVENIDSVNIPSVENSKCNDFDVITPTIPSSIAKTKQKKIISNTQHYYQRKKFDKNSKEVAHFLIGEIIDDWDDGVSDKAVENKVPSEISIQPNLSDFDDADSVITIASGTSESCNDSKSDKNEI